jgi:hypothetical protein
METLSKHDENNLIKATQRAISYTQQGMSANDAIQKVAEEEQYNPNFVDRMVQGFNKAKSVHMMKEASPQTRADSFSLADAHQIISNIFQPVEKVASQDVQLPGDLSKTIGQPPNPPTPMEKVASEDAPLYEKDGLDKMAVDALTPATFMRKYETHVDFMNKMVKIAQDEVAGHKQKMFGCFKEAGETIQRMQPSEIQKVARLVINSYGEYMGNKMMKVLQRESGITIPEMNKTANSAVFPAHQPFGYIQDAFQHAHNMVDAECWVRHLEKEAGLATSFLANAAAELVTDPITDANKSGKDRDPDDSLNADHYNRSKGLEAKRALYSMVNSEEFAPYEHSEIVKAWNQLAQEHPKMLMTNPAGARTLMLQNLEGGGQRDLHEIAQAQQVADPGRGKK